MGALYSVADLPAYLLGEWHLEREVLDRTEARLGHFVGRATIERHGETLVYAEQGELSYAGWSGTARRTWSYELGAPGCALVRLGDGAFFYDLDWRDGLAGVRHRCGADTYLGIHLALGRDLFETRWRVLGPTTAQLITTRARRCADPRRRLEPVPS